MISLQNISVHKFEKQILHVPFLSVNKGDVVGLIGPNGAGKSTLLKVMALLEEGVHGDITIKDTKIAASRPTLEKRRLFSMVFQQPLMLDTTVFNNVAVGLKIRGFSKTEIKKKVEEWLDKLRISHLAQRHARTLSGGESQRVALARALVTQPEILFLDEPFSALDLPTKRRIMADLQAIISDLHITTVFISHDFQEIKLLCEEVFVLFQGEYKGRYRIDDLSQQDFNQELQQFIKEWNTPLIEGYYT